MKVKVALIFVSLFAALFQSCTEDAERQAENVQFTFSVTSSGSHSGGRTAAELPEGAELVISLTDNNGAPVLTHEHIPLLSLGGSYITEPRDLIQGKYKVTDFMIVSGSNILYATPQKASPLAPAVIRPLPFSFNVIRNKVTNIEMEVIATESHLPEDFGYVSFDVNVVNPLRLAVFTTHLGKTSLTTAEAFLYKSNVLVKRFDLGAKINLVSFEGDPEASYKLVIRKATYEDYVHVFTYQELINQLGSLPFKIFLSPTFTLKTAPVDAFEMVLDGTGGIIDVDWGDGYVETFDFSSDPMLFLEHSYDAIGEYLITVSGAIDQITQFYSYYGGGKAVDVNFSHLASLQAVRFGLTVGPSVIDLSNNPHLAFINIAGIQELEQVILPTEHNISFIIMSGPNLFDTAAIDAVINSVYTNAVADHTIGGWFSLQADWSDYESGLLGPPSPAAMAQLNELATVYGWHVNE